jgi:hypothetical protein
MITNPTLPEGWTSEDLGRDQLLISAPCDHLTVYVTVDFFHRGFRAGQSTTGPFSSRTPYGGLGWGRRLIDDAVAHLKEVIG